jgi:hypothetical protein
MPPSTTIAARLEPGTDLVRLVARRPTGPGHRRPLHRTRSASWLLIAGTASFVQRDGWPHAMPPANAGRIHRLPSRPTSKPCCRASSAASTGAMPAPKGHPRTAQARRCARPASDTAATGLALAARCRPAPRWRRKVQGADPADSRRRRPADAARRRRSTGRADSRRPPGQAFAGCAHAPFSCPTQRFPRRRFALS